MSRRVLVLGATSYVAQFVLRRFLSGDGRVADAVSEMACTVRGHPQASELPDGLELASAVAATAATATPAGDPRRVRVFPGVTFADADAVRACIDAFQPDVVLNCIAMASPAACEKNLELATAINEPYDLLALLGDGRGSRPAPHLVHFSTDYVYRGDRSAERAYREEDAVVDAAGGSGLSVYGAGKLRFDAFLQAHPPPGGCSVLRIANVVGGRAPLFKGSANPAPKFMEWLHAQLFSPADRAAVSTTATASAPSSSPPPLKLWIDEYRSFLFVRDLEDVVYALIARADTLRGRTRVLNVGGIDTLTRMELALKYLAASGAHQRMTREVVPAKRALVDLGYPAPLAARLDIARLNALLPELRRTPTAEFLALISRELSVPPK